MFSTKRFGIRFAVYIMGLFIMTLGIAVSVKSDLGVSPVSSIPYTITCIFGMEMGNATIVFHMGLVLLQIILLRRNFKWINLLQLIVGVIFGKFTTLCNSLVALIPMTDNIVIRLIMIFISAALIAIGIFFYLPADIVPLAGEGATQAISNTIHLEFSKTKIIFDASMVAISLIACLIAIHSMGSVGVGTIIAAFLVGAILGVVNRMFEKQRDRLLNGSEA